MKCHLSTSIYDKRDDFDFEIIFELQGKFKRKDPNQMATSKAQTHQTNG